MSATKILPAEPGDAEDFARIKLKAFNEESFHRAIFGDCTSLGHGDYQTLLVWQTAVFDFFLQQPDDRTFKAVDEGTGRTVGYASWDFPDQKHATEIARREEADVKIEQENDTPDGPIDVNPPGHQLPTFVDGKILERVEVVFGQAKKRFLGDRAEEVCTLGSVAVLPEYRRQGIAQKLLDAGSAIVDERKQAAYLEASPTANKLYMRNGFEMLEGGGMELVPGYVMCAMLRKASESKV